jgi:hypothetical protein
MIVHNIGKLEYWSVGVNKISECRFRIADLTNIANLVLQSAIRNLKSAIYFAPLLHFSIIPFWALPKKSLSLEVKYAKSDDFGNWGASGRH